MSSLLIAFIGLIYLGIGINYIYNSQVPFGLVFLGYAMGNLGLYLAGRVL